MWVYMLCSLLSVSAFTILAVESVPASKQQDKQSLVSKQVNTKISGGTLVEDISEFPYLVEYEVEDGESCAGVIYNENYILTVAHCVVNATGEMIDLRAGSTVRGEGMELQISQVLVHPNYSSMALEYDIAILSTLSPINFDENVKPITIAEANSEPSGEIVVAGFGEMRNGGSPSEELKQAEVVVISQQECESFYGDLITENVFCTQQEHEGEGPCTGDDGGPAVKMDVLYGLIDFAPSCGNTVFPSTYTNIGAVAINNFITENAGGQDSELFVTTVV